MKQLIIIAIAILIYGCDKKKSSASAYLYNTSGEEPFKFIPCSLLKDPAGIGWTDTSLGTITDLKRVMINPINKEEVIYAAAGNIYNFNKQTKQKKLIANNLFNYLLQINQFGEILYCDPSFNICKVKSNGDSLKVYNHGSYEPYWDYTGKFIYYHSGVTLYKVNAATGVLSTTYSGMPQPLCFSRTSDKLLFKNNTLKTLFYKDVITGIVTTVASNVNGLTLSTSIDNQENVYFGNDDGIYKADMITKKVDTLYKNCPYLWTNTGLSIPSTYVYNPHLSPNGGVLTFIYKHSIPINIRKKYTVSYALEMDLTTKKVYEIKGIP